MDTLFIAKDAKLEREDYTIVIKATGCPKRRIPIHAVRNIVIAGECGITTALLSSLAMDNVRVTVLDWHGNVSGSFEPAGHPSSGAVHLAQARHILDSSLRLAIATEIVAGTIRNLRANLRYRLYRGSTTLQPFIQSLSDIEKNLNSAPNVPSLMGFEGTARAWYYDAWKEISPHLDFGPRRRRPPNNRINCLISWFNGLSYTLVRNEIAKTHLDGCLSFLHSPSEVRHSLALDLSEPFKPVVADTLIFEIVLRDVWKDDWFHQTPGICRLTEVGRRETLEMWTKKVDYSNDADDPDTSLRASIRKECFKVERHVLGIENYTAYTRKI